jgi:uncharacterized protein YfiM (DUF2279 family)
VSDRVVAVAFRLAFWLPLAASAWFALAPAPPGLPFSPSDAILHAGAFAYLTLAGRLAFPRSSAWTIGLWMVGYGALIEVLQGLGAVRAAEWRDLFMDLAGIAIGFALHGLVRAPVERLLARLAHEADADRP